MTNEDVLDVVGVGFGPSNLALAIALEEHNRAVSPEQQLTSLFLEQQAQFGWHRGMLIPGATMQVSFLKDLVTQRNSCSEYSFLNYLSERGRLTHFTNLQTFFPTRLEFHDYLEWAAQRVSTPVQYQSEVTDISANGDVFEITRRGLPTVRSHNVVLAGGIVGKLPPGVTTGRRVFHNHGLLHHLADLPARTQRRFVVVGSGQSGAEVTAHLHQTYPDSDVHAVFGKYGYTPSDDSPYANRIFDPEAVTDFNSSNEGLREQLLAYHRGTNYSAVDLELIEDLYRREYAERVAGHRRLFVQGASAVTSVEESPDGVAVQIARRTDGTETTLLCDAVIYATGFRSKTIAEVGMSLAPHCLTDTHGRPAINADYRLETSDVIRGEIFIQGNTEHTHGLTSTLLSNLAVRSGELVSSLAASTARCTHDLTMEARWADVRTHELREAFAEKH
ncbi:lysine N(6)-hydroxylase/L-ornithine N(5)-oxygenase family protein [Demetria terragena]|uniref:lysine N(6)-hydroxylase/L-ornithine N(5)-oxygenase family protein n=1 Tax=Demetria terragena TaxID=63959 RepID=UPI00037FF52D|nr:SidA/IucD/PvdA family monooxygenase [Demetria terragena]